MSCKENIQVNQDVLFDIYLKDDLSFHNEDNNGY